MSERLGNLTGDEILSVEPNIDPEISSKDGSFEPNPDLSKTLPIHDRILSHPTSRSITHTSGPNSR